MGSSQRQRRGVPGLSRRTVAALIASMVASIGCVTGGAMASGDAPPPEPQATETPGQADESLAPAPAVRVTDVDAEKLIGPLAEIASVARVSGDEAALDTARLNGLTSSGGSVRVLVESASADLTAARAAIVAAGGTIEGEYADTIQALVPPSGLEQVATNPDVRLVRAPAARTPGRAR
ncbi:MAG: hypothetical protein AB7P40_31080 [Chloroflexota bacterium]